MQNTPPAASWLGARAAKGAPGEHYTLRPLDLLRVHHEKIEAWILEQAGVTFDAKAAPGALRVVNS